VRGEEQCRHRTNGAMKVNELAEQLKSGLKPVYVIFGPEEYFRAQALRMLRERAEAEKMDISEPGTEELDPRRFFDELRTPSLFAPSRMVIVEHAEPLFGAPLKDLLAYAAKPSQRTALVLAAEELKAKSAKRGGRKTQDEAEETRAISPVALLKKAVAVECPLLTRRELPAWCVARARELGKRMDFAATNMLIELAGQNLGQLNEQIKSLATFSKEGPSITGKMVSELVGGDHMRSIWEFITAVSERKAAAALKSLDRLMRDGDISSSGIIGFLATEVRRMLTVKRMQEQRMPVAEIARATRMQPWLVEKTARSAREVSYNELRRRLRLLVRADANIKTGAIQDEWGMERLTMEMCGVART
jgi:DNA polymerase III subunit delta